MRKQNNIADKYNSSLCILLNTRDFQKVWKPAIKKIDETLTSHFTVIFFLKSSSRNRCLDFFKNRKIKLKIVKFGFRKKQISIQYNKSILEKQFKKKKWIYIFPALSVSVRRIIASYGQDVLDFSRHSHYHHDRPPKPPLHHAIAVQQEEQRAASESRIRSVAAVVATTRSLHFVLPPPSNTATLDPVHRNTAMSSALVTTSDAERLCYTKYYVTFWVSIHASMPGRPRRVAAVQQCYMTIQRNHPLPSPFFTLPISEDPVSAAITCLQCSRGITVQVHFLKFSDKVKQTKKHRLSYFICNDVITGALASSSLFCLYIS